MKRISPELAAEIEAALGHPPPDPEDAEGWRRLAQEVAQKAPNLYRRLMDEIHEEKVREVKNRATPPTARPLGIKGWFYVQDADGGWVPSRRRILAAIMLASLGVSAAILWLPMRASGLSVELEEPAAVEAPPEAAPREQTLPKPQDAEAPAATSATQARPQPVPQKSSAVVIEAPPPAPEEPVLPPPPPDLPPPPDYEGDTSQPALEVVYRRPTSTSTAGGTEPAALDLRAVREHAESKTSDAEVVYVRGGNVEAAEDGVWLLSSGKAAGNEDGVYVVSPPAPATASPVEVYERAPKPEANGLVTVYERPREEDYSESP